MYSTTDEASDDVSSVCVCVIMHLVFPLQSPPDAAVLWYIDFKEYQRHYRDKVCMMMIATVIITQWLLSFDRISM